ncbi:unnamed protein product [Caenorhabditis bovis]|uniref:Asparagine synthetase domain-containing protein n=1 Tax=Caenorhabditis bovis TaxID=2654633 RepID=A0A8S1F681_9PELO|nr:unnamed protein product [Caenorhabditis bovis]
MDYNTWWMVENGKLFEMCDGKCPKRIEHDFLVFPASFASIDKTELSAKTEEEIVDEILDTNGSWSIIYYNKNLEKIFFGRDVFGRQSLVCNNSDSKFLIGCRVNPEITTGEWIEVPYGQVTVMDLKDSSDIEMTSYFDEYPDDVLRGDFATAPLKTVNKKRNLLNVRRKATNIDEGPKPSSALFWITVRVTENLLKNCQQRVGICLSGGVDSTFIAHVAHHAIPKNYPLDLVNVAFGDSREACSKAPDRKRSIEALKSIRAQYQDRVFRLILVDVHSEELLNCRKQYISTAARPACSVLDDSLSCVLWFALRAEGRDYDTDERVDSEARIMLLGSGADELLAGYARHRTRFEKDQNVECVAEECELELRRLGSRNGGRDARVAAQLRKTIITIISPLLEDDVVEFLNNLPGNSKWDLSLPRGVGEKKILREAVRDLGSPYDMPKQAMQFGSRMAQMSNQGNSAIKGSDKSPHLT